MKINLQKLILVIKQTTINMKIKIFVNIWIFKYLVIKSTIFSFLKKIYSEFKKIILALREELLQNNIKL